MKKLSQTIIGSRIVAKYEISVEVDKLLEELVCTVIEEYEELLNRVMSILLDRTSNTYY